MGVRILTDRQSDYPQAILYCSTSDWAFGPVFCASDDHEHEADERAESFLRFLKRDPRRLTESELQTAYSNWLVQEAAQWQAEEAAEAAKYADDDAEPV